MNQNYGSPAGSNFQGYMSSPTGAYNNSPNSPKEPNKTYANQSLQPFTIKQLHNAQQAHPDDAFKIDGRELSQITVVGHIFSVSSQSTNLQLNIDDGTAQIEARLWIDDQDTSEYQLNLRASFVEGVYVRVIGHLRSFNDKKNIVAFKILPITDFNEITFHHLEVIYVHLFNTKGGDAGAIAGFNQNNNFNGNFAPNPNLGNGNLTDLQNSILQVVREEAMTQGTALESIYQTLSNYPQQEVKQAVDWLVEEEGLLYSTIDEHHYSITD